MNKWCSIKEKKVSMARTFLRCIKAGLTKQRHGWSRYCWWLTPSSHWSAKIFFLFFCSTLRGWVLGSIVSKCFTVFRDHITKKKIKKTGKKASMSVLYKIERDQGLHLLHRACNVKRSILTRLFHILL